MAALTPIFNPGVDQFNNLITNFDLEDNDSERRNGEHSPIAKLTANNSSMISSLIQEVNPKKAMIELFKAATMFIGISSLDFKVTPLITRFAIDKLGLCLNPLISNKTKSLVSYIINPLSKFNADLSYSLFGDNLTGLILMPAALEELEFRWLIQDVAFKKIPEQILKWIAPQYAHVVDSNAVRITRIALTALLFSICHLHQLDCTGMGGIGPLIGGLLYGYFYEYTPWSLPGCINLHGFYNILDYSNLI